MHTRKNGDMLHAGNAPLAAAITPLSTAWFSPAPRLRADMSAMVNPFCFLDTKRTRMARFDEYQSLPRKNMARVRPGGRGRAWFSLGDGSDDHLKNIIEWVLAK